MYEQLGNEIGASQGISIALHEDDEDEATTRASLQRLGSKVALEKEKKKKCAYTQLSGNASASLLDQ